VNAKGENKIMRRVAGFHDLRLDGISELLNRTRTAAVLDVGCNRGRVADEFYRNGAKLVHGCDIDPDCINVARHNFADLRAVESRFEIVDLTKGPSALNVFGEQRYHIVVMLATYHKIKRAMPPKLLSELVRAIGNRTLEYFGWRGTSYDLDENEAEMRTIDKDMAGCGMKRVHTSYISHQLGAAAIWERPT
jgi:SAM-dependent methyltransferase